MSEAWKALGVILSCLVLATCLAYAQNNNLLFLPSTSKGNIELYCAVYPYSYNGMVSLNETDFMLQLEKVKQIGFKGVLLWNVECFYDDGKLKWVMDKAKELGLNVLIPFNYFNRSYSFPFPSEAWKQKGFFNDAELNLYCQYITNVSTIVKSYINFKGYLVYFPYESDTTENYWYWYDNISTNNYYWRYVKIMEAIRKVDGHPIYPSVMLWSAYPIDIYRKLPKNFPYNVEGFAFQPYNTIVDDIQKDKIKEIYDYFKNYGNPQIGEIGYCTMGIYEHGKASSETKKAQMIKDFLDYVKSLRYDGFICYFGLTDFPPENADFGLVYDDYSLKPSGNAFKQWMMQNES
jgi:hypothetical protein